MTPRSKREAENDAENLSYSRRTSTDYAIAISQKA